MTFRFRDLAIDGRSRAGDATWFRVNPPGIALDVGRGPLRLTGVRDVFLSHGHLDHASGLPFLLSHRTMAGAAEPTRVHCPEPIAAAVERFVRAAAELEEREYDYQVVAMAPGSRAAPRRDFVVEAFATEHPVPSLGYHLLRRKRRLSPEHEGRDPAEIAELRTTGVEVTVEVEEPVLSYCGDTGPGVFESEPRLFDAPILFVEVTYLGDRHHGRARDYGHTHLEDLVELRDRFRNEVIVLHHLSRRHRPAELRRTIDERLPGIAERIHVWGAGR